MDIGKSHSNAKEYEETERRMSLKQVLSGIKSSDYSYGTCNGRYARKHNIQGNVQFILWKKGDQSYVDGIGHTEDVWVDFHSSWWGGFIPSINNEEES